LLGEEAAILDQIRTSASPDKAAFLCATNQTALRFGSQASGLQIHSCAGILSNQGLISPRGNSARCFAGVRLLNPLWLDWATWERTFRRWRQGVRDQLHPVGSGVFSNTVRVLRSDGRIFPTKGSQPNRATITKESRPGQLSRLFNLMG